MRSRPLEKRQNGRPRRRHRTPCRPPTCSSRAAATVETMVTTLRMERTTIWRRTRRRMSFLRLQKSCARSNAISTGVSSRLARQHFWSFGLHRVSQLTARRRATILRSGLWQQGRWAMTDEKAFKTSIAKRRASSLPSIPRIRTVARAQAQALQGTSRPEAQAAHLRTWDVGLIRTSFRSFQRRRTSRSSRAADRNRDGTGRANCLARRTIRPPS